RFAARRIRTAGARGAGVVESHGDGAARPLAHTGDEVGEGERLTLLSRQGILERVADQIAFAGGQRRARRLESVGRVAAQTKKPRRTRHFHGAAKALRL